MKLHGTFQDITQRKRAEIENAIRSRIVEIFLEVPDDEMYAEVLLVILEAMESEYGVFGYIAENGDFVVPSMTRHIWDQCEVADKRHVFTRETWGDSSWPRAVRDKRTVHSNEPSVNVPEGHIGILRHISLPLLERGEVIGVIQVANKKTDYTRDDIGLLEAIGRHIAPALGARFASTAPGDRPAPGRGRPSKRASGLWPR